ncbi:hypothetical protein AVEN_136112-1 [Araneus ventricosus]|uniref:Uncharacterized protein n=1 Tax=Araneus ventricosus TaxID=182803 RepID=A0A4Y2TU72_ARAVE|nr:hypothetical protein AVEN_136112-1 [Araneus ventricosus]
MGRHARPTRGGNLLSMRSKKQTERQLLLMESSLAYPRGKEVKSKGRDIKASSRESIVEKVVAPLVKIFKDREKVQLSTIYDLKSSQLDITERQYQSKIRSCEATIESLKGKLSILSSELSDYKQEFKESSRINRISKVSRGGLIIEAPNTDELQALERELACVSTIEEHFDVSRPKKRSPQVILIGVPGDIDKERLSKGLSAKNIFLCDSANKPLFELNFSMKTSEHNQRQGTTFDVNHGPYDRAKCESYDKQRANLMRHTDYGFSSGAPG